MSDADCLVRRCNLCLRNKHQKNSVASSKQDTITGTNDELITEKMAATVIITLTTMELDTDVDALAAALSFVDSAAGHFSTDLASSLHSFAPSGTVFAPLGGDFPGATSDFEALWQAHASDPPSSLPSPGLATHSGAADRSPTLLQVTESQETEGTDSDGQSLRSSGSVADASPGRVPSKPSPARRLQATGGAKKRALNYNPNRAREERRKELLALREEAATLESQLSTLQNVVARQNTSGTCKQARTPMGNSIAQSVWKGMAERQLEKRLEATRENCDLKSAVRTNRTTIHRMAKLLRSHNAERVRCCRLIMASWSRMLYRLSADTSTLGTFLYWQAARSFSIERFHQLLEYTDLKLGPALVERLMAGVAKCYHEVDNVFRDCHVDVSRVVTFSAPQMQTDADGNLFTRVQASKVFPYGVHATGMAAWTQFSQSVRPNARCFFAEVGELVRRSISDALHLMSVSFVASDLARHGRPRRRAVRDGAAHGRLQDRGPRSASQAQVHGSRARCGGVAVGGRPY